MCDAHGSAVAIKEASLFNGDRDHEAHVGAARPARQQATWNVMFVAVLLLEKEGFVAYWLTMITRHMWERLDLQRHQVFRNATGWQC